MGRIRTIKPEFWVSEQIGNLSRDARLLFIGMWGSCDDRGVHPAKPKQLKAEVFPMDDIPATDLEGWIRELIAGGLIVEFEADGEHYWHVVKWAKHQRIDRPTFKHPAPPAADSTNPRRVLDEPTSSAPRHAVEASTSNPLPLAPGVEGIGLEGIGETTPSAAPTGRRPPIPDCSYDGIVAAYHAKLPQLPEVRLRTEKRNKAMRMRWQWVLTERRDDGTTRATNAAEALAWFARFFERAQHNDFIMGRSAPSPGHANWRADLDFLMSDKGLVQVLEKTEVPA